MGIGWQQILIVAVLAILLFGRGKISELMGDVAKGIKSFRKGLADDEQPAAKPEALKEGQTIDAEAKKDSTPVS